MSDNKAYISFQVDTEGLFGEEQMRLLLRDALGEFQDARSPVARYLSNRHPELVRGSPPYETKANEVLARILLAGKLAYGLGYATYRNHPDGHPNCLPFDAAYDCLTMLNAIGFGKPGSANRLSDMVAEACKEITNRRRDAELAAGELLVPIPEPGTDLGRLLLANRILISKVNRLEHKLSEIVDLARGKE